MFIIFITIIFIEMIQKDTDWAHQWKRWGGKGVERKKQKWNEQEINKRYLNSPEI